MWGITPQTSGCDGSYSYFATFGYEISLIENSFYLSMIFMVAESNIISVLPITTLVPSDTFFSFPFALI